MPDIINWAGSRMCVRVFVLIKSQVFFSRSHNLDSIFFSVFFFLVLSLSGSLSFVSICSSSVLLFCYFLGFVWFSLNLFNCRRHRPCIFTHYSFCLFNLFLFGFLSRNQKLCQIFELLARICVWYYWEYNESWFVRACSDVYVKSSKKDLLFFSLLRSVFIVFCMQDNLLCGNAVNYMHMAHGFWLCYLHCLSDNFQSHKSSFTKD